MNGGTVRVEAHLLRSFSIAVVVSLILAFVFGAGLAEHIATATIFWIFNDDVRQQVWPFLANAGFDGLSGDYIRQYYVSILPTGYTGLYSLAALVVDPRTLSKILPYALLILLLAALALAAHRLGGGAAAWCSVALCLSAGVFMSRMTGGLPRSFAFPIVAWASAALVLGRPGWLALAVIAGSAFYPPVGLVAGLSLTVMVLLPSEWGGFADEWSVARRLILLSLTGIVCVILLLPQWLMMKPYGPLLGPQNVAEYPEVGAGGRYDRDDSFPFPGIVHDIVKCGAAALEGTDPACCPPLRRWIDGGYSQESVSRGATIRLAVLMIALVGLGVSAVRDPAAGRLWLLLGSAVVSHTASILMAPRLFIPSRFILYTLPILGILALCASGNAVAKLAFKEQAQAHWSPVLTIILTSLVILSLGGRGPGQAGYTVRISARLQPLYEFLSSVAPNAVIAGMPDGPIENVPYLCGRRILYGAEVNLVSQRRYADEMRRRFRLFADAYFSQELGPLLRLKDQLQVTHLIVKRGDFHPGAVRSFEPFQSWLDDKYRQMREGKEAEVFRHPEAVVFSKEPYIVLELQLLAREKRSE